MKTWILFFILFSHAHAYTLNNNFGASFKSSNVRIKIAGDTTCATAGITVYELEDLINPAINNFWNRVPTSNLRLSYGGFNDSSDNKINTGRLCAPTDDKCINDAVSGGKVVIPPATDIVIACNNLGDNFGGANVLAVTIPNHFSGKSITGSVILINNTSGSFGALSKSDKISVIAHEIGHAIGLGHTDDKAALMYYRTVDQRRALGEDDIRGVSYLYPMKLDGFGLLGGCATIEQSPPPPTSFWPLPTAFMFMIVLFELMRLFKRSKARATL